MQTFKLTSRPIEQIDDLDGFEWKLGEFFAARTYPVRLIVRSRPFDMDVLVRALQREQHDLRRLARIVKPLLAGDRPLARTTATPIPCCRTRPRRRRSTAP